MVDCKAVLKFRASTDSRCRKPERHCELLGVYKNTRNRHAARALDVYVYRRDCVTCLCALVRLSHSPVALSGSHGLWSMLWSIGTPHEHEEAAREPSSLRKPSSAPFKRKKDHVVVTCDRRIAQWLRKRVVLGGHDRALHLNTPSERSRPSKINKGQTKGWASHVHA